MFQWENALFSGEFVDCTLFTAMMYFSLRICIFRREEPLQGFAARAALLGDPAAGYADAPLVAEGLAAAALALAAPEGASAGSDGAGTRDALLRCAGRLAARGRVRHTLLSMFSLTPSYNGFSSNSSFSPFSNSNS